MNDSHKQTPKKMDHGSGHSIATCFGVIGWLFHGILSVITAGLIIDVYKRQGLMCAKLPILQKQDQICNQEILPC